MTNPTPTTQLISDLQSGDDNAKIAAIQQLGNSGDPQVFAPLLEALNIPRWRVRAAAAEALGKLRDPRAVTSLIALLTGLVDEETKIKSAWALGNIGDQRAVPALRSVVMGRAEQADSLLSRTCAQALAALGATPNAMQLLSSVKRARTRAANAQRQYGIWTMIVGVAFLALGIGGTISSLSSSATAGSYTIYWGAILVGLINLGVGFYRWQTGDA